MNRRSFMQSLAGACLGPLLSPNSRINVNAATTIDTQTQSEIFDDFACVIGLGEYGRRAIEALSKIHSNMHLFEYTGTISRNLNQSLADGLFTFIVSNPRNSAEIELIERLMRIGRANKSFAIFVGPKTHLLQKRLHAARYLSSYITLSINRSQDQNLMDVLHSIYGIFQPFCGEYGPIPDLHICDQMHVSGAKIGSIHYGHSDNSLRNAFDDALADFKNSKKSGEYAFVSALSPHDNSVLELCDYVGEYSQKFECEQNLLWSWTKASLFGRNFTVVVYMFEDTNRG